jgi:hypothetical protein
LITTPALVPKGVNAKKAVKMHPGTVGTINPKPKHRRDAGKNGYVVSGEHKSSPKHRRDAGKNELNTSSLVSISQFRSIGVMPVGTREYYSVEFQVDNKAPQ